MIDNVPLSKRETEVLKLLLQGKSNRQIAMLLDISIRTVEFHLKNIYAKLQVNSRVELILKLGNTVGTSLDEKLGQSTVDSQPEIAENRDRLNSRRDWVTSLRDTISMFGKEVEMKSFFNSKHILVGVLTALSTGILWVSIMLYSQTIPLYEFKGRTVPLIVVWVMIGLSVGLIGKHNGHSLRRVFFGALFGTGLSPFLIIPLMLIVVLPLGKLAEWIGLIDPSTMSNNVATILTTVIMITIWLVVGIAIGITLLFVTIKKSEQMDFHGQIREHHM